MEIIAVEQSQEECKVPSQDDLLKVFEAAKLWHSFQSIENTTTLYNTMSKVLKSKFDPTEYDNVE